MTRIFPALIAGAAERMSSKLRVPPSLSGRNPSIRLVKSARGRIPARHEERLKPPIRALKQQDALRRQTVAPRAAGLLGYTSREAGRS